MRQVVQAEIYNDFDFTWAFQREHTWIVGDIFFGIVAASLPVLNALLPKRWRLSGHHKPALSTLKSNPNNSIRLDSHDTLQVPDGTIKEDDSAPFQKTTEKRWDGASAVVQRPEPARDCGDRGGSEKSDDTLV